MRSFFINNHIKFINFLDEFFQKQSPGVVLKKGVCKNPQENTCAKVSFLYFFMEHLQTTAFVLLYDIPFYYFLYYYMNQRRIQGFNKHLRLRVL